jgi:hypothetical protein
MRSWSVVSGTGRPAPFLTSYRQPPKRRLRWGRESRTGRVRTLPPRAGAAIPPAMLLDASAAGPAVDCRARSSAQPHRASLTTVTEYDPIKDRSVDGQSTRIGVGSYEAALVGT